MLKPLQQNKEVTLASKRDNIIKTSNLPAISIKLPSQTIVGMEITPTIKKTKNIERNSSNITIVWEKSGPFLCSYPNCSSPAHTACLNCLDSSMYHCENLNHASSHFNSCHSSNSKSNLFDPFETRLSSLLHSFGHSFFSEGSKYTYDLFSEKKGFKDNFYPNIFKTFKPFLVRPFIATNSYKPTHETIGCIFRTNLIFDLPIKDLFKIPNGLSEEKWQEAFRALFNSFHRQIHPITQNWKIKICDFTKSADFSITTPLLKGVCSETILNSSSFCPCILNSKEIVDMSNVNVLDYGKFLKPFYERLNENTKIHFVFFSETRPTISRPGPPSKRKIVMFEDDKDLLSVTEKEKGSNKTKPHQLERRGNVEVEGFKSSSENCAGPKGSERSQSYSESSIDRDANSFVLTAEDILKNRKALEDFSDFGSGPKKEMVASLIGQGIYKNEGPDRNVGFVKEFFENTENFSSFGKLFGLSPETDSLGLLGDSAKNPSKNVDLIREANTLNSLELIETKSSSFTKSKMSASLSQDSPAHSMKTRTVLSSNYTKESTEFTVATFNILSQRHSNTNNYTYCPKYALAWGYRKGLILERIWETSAEILCLQEISLSQFEGFILPSMKEKGYDGVFSARPTSTTKYKDKEGSAVLWKTERFLLDSYASFDLNDFANRSFSYNLPNEEIKQKLKRLIHSNICLGVLLKDRKVCLSIESKGAVNKLLVANPHIFWNPSYSDVKLWQVLNTVNFLEKTCEEQKAALIIAGDFNSQPDSAVYEFLSTGKIDPSHFELRLDPLNILADHDNFTHRMHLESAYGKCGEPSYSNFTEGFVGLLDYIWYSPGSLKCRSILDVYKKKELREYGALPSPKHPSDHIILAASFKWDFGFSNFNIL